MNNLRRSFSFLKLHDTNKREHKLATQPDTKNAGNGTSSLPVSTTTSRTTPVVSTKQETEASSVSNLTDSQKKLHSASPGTSFESAPTEPDREITEPQPQTDESITHEPGVSKGTTVGGEADRTSVASSQASKPETPQSAPQKTPQQTPYTSNQNTPQRTPQPTPGHSRKSSSIFDTKNESTASLSSLKGKKPAGSVLELKRFFGQGRTKHEHGVSMSESSKRPTFNLFGKRRHNHKDGHREQSTPPTTSTVGSTNTASSTTPSTTPGTPGDNGHSESYFSLASFRHRKKSQNTTSSQLVDNFSQVQVKGKPPSDLDPNFVVHAPDYEAEWDPFHVFGLEHSSERLPFLESGITKYGEMGKDVGSGAGGSVRTMERPSDHKVFAVKEFRPRRANETVQKYSKHVAAEYALGAALHNKNIIQTIDLIKEGDKYYEIMEYGPHDFFELVMSGQMNTAQVNSSFAQVLSGVAYLHSIGVAHRDLKLDNCVVDNSGVVKIIDFGSSVVYQYPMSPQIHLARGIMGSDPYLAPEVFLRHPYQPQCADVWSCGIIYACTYMRRFPWKLPQKEDTSFRKYCENPTNTTGQPPQPDNPRKITGPWRLLRLLPSDSRDLILRMLTVEVKDRVTMEEVVKNEWYKSIEQISVLPA